MVVEAVQQLAKLLAERNAVDARIAALIGRPALAGHVGEFLAAQVFYIELAESQRTQRSTADSAVLRALELDASHNRARGAS